MFMYLFVLPLGLGKAMLGASGHTVKYSSQHNWATAIRQHENKNPSAISTSTHSTTVILW